MATEENLTGEVSFASEAIDVLFETLSKTNECVVVDLPRPTFGIRNQTLRAASHIVLVTEFGLSGLRDTIRLLGNIEEAAPKAKILIVANHGGGDHQAMRLPDFQKALGRKVDLIVPQEAKAFNEATNTGKPLVQFAARSKAAKALQKLASDIIGKKPKAKGGKSKSAGPKKPLFGLGKKG